MWSFLSDPPSIVQFAMLIACVPLGVSHIVQPRMWVDFFARLNAQGHAGLLTKVLLVEFWPALLIVTLHQVWSGPAIVLTLYGWALLAKVLIGLLLPQLGMRSMGMPERLGARGFVPAGVALIVVGLSAGAALIWG